MLNKEGEYTKIEDVYIHIISTCNTDDVLKTALEEGYSSSMKILNKSHAKSIRKEKIAFEYRKQKIADIFKGIINDENQKGDEKPQLKLIG